MKKMDTGAIDRRELILRALALGGGLGLRAFATGLPISFLTRRAMAATNGTYLIYAASASGDPVNCNVPGTYITGYDHPAVWSNPTPIQFGSQTLSAAAVWGTLKPEIRNMANFFHLRIRTNGHNEMPNVTKFLGAIQPLEGRAAEMLPSVIGYEVGKLRGTLLEQPIALGGDLSYKGRSQKVYKPTDLKDIFPTGLSNIQKNMRQFRDQQVDLVYRDLASTGTPAQKKFFDERVISGQAAQTMANLLAVELNTITANDAASQMRTAAALLKTGVTSAVMLKVGFGDDNHTDTGLVNEEAEHNKGVGILNSLHDALTSYGIEDETTFAMINVFGRTPKINARGGRDHFGKHSIMFSFGPSVRPGMVGGVALTAGGSGQPESQGINSSTGGIANPDILIDETLQSAGKSLMRACGLSQTTADKYIVGGKTVQTYYK